MFSGNNDIGLTSANDAGAVTEYLKENLKPTDLVLASPQILWAVPTSQQTDWGITAAYDHQDREKNRYAYSCSLTNVKYAVVDPLALNFVTGLGPQMEKLVEVTSGWPVVFRAGELTVHENPLLVIGE